MSGLWEKIKAARLSAELTQEELAEKCGVNRATVSMWESKDPTKRIKPRKHNLEKISDATGAPLGWLKSKDAGIDDTWLEQNQDWQTADVEQRIVRERQENHARAKRSVQELYLMVEQNKLTTDEYDLIISLVRAFQRGR
ncbi:helix-turn-helix domain-containing protein [Zooshikella ganghwensis]|uniref:XRE family transcriptional regulator n=1 Tax=Zooshikella ganghwensis TaxID=202772 RepID=A0A4V1IP36_9GAMM|nr:helix-turn-helix transcriptional regulator [Zooshikella ganghwensis]RDH45861.1 XRE family transcriptional regulator [Zooshikella ganghwensis]